MSALLSIEQKDEIRRLYCKGVRLKHEAKKYTIRAIAKKYGRCTNTVWLLCNGMDIDECTDGEFTDEEANEISNSNFTVNGSSSNGCRSDD